jgi:hypothetical protein
MRAMIKCRVSGSKTYVFLNETVPTIQISILLLLISKSKFLLLLLLLLLVLNALGKLKKIEELQSCMSKDRRKENNLVQWRDSGPIRLEWWILG